MSHEMVLFQNKLREKKEIDTFHPKGDMNQHRPIAFTMRSLKPNRRLYKEQATAVSAATAAAAAASFASKPHWSIDRVACPRKINYAILTW